MSAAAKPFALVAVNLDENGQEFDPVTLSTHITREEARRALGAERERLHSVPAHDYDLTEISDVVFEQIDLGGKPFCRFRVERRA